MKKFLFTLAALVGVGFAAHAAYDGNENCPVTHFTDGNLNSSEAITEIHATPGQTLVIGIQIEKPVAAIKGLQFNFEMRKPDGSLYSGFETTNDPQTCVFDGINFVSTPMGIPAIHLVYMNYTGNADLFAWFGACNNIQSTESNGVSQANGTSHQVSAWDPEGPYMPGTDYIEQLVNPLYTGLYRVIVANTTTGVIYPTRGTSFPWTVLYFTVKVESNWSDEYADFTMTRGDWSLAGGLAPKFNPEDYLNLRFINDAPADAVADPVLNWDAETYTMTLTEGTLYVDGQEVASPYVVEKADVDRLLQFKGVNATGGVVYQNVLVPAGEGAEPVVDIEEPKIAVAGDGTLEATVTITNPATEGTIMYSMDNETWTAYTEALTFTEVGSYTVYAKVVNGDNESDVVNESFTVREETTAPAPAFRVEDGKVYAEKDGYEVTLQLKNGEGEWVTVPNPYTLPEAGAVDQALSFQAQTIANTEDNNSAWEPFEYTVQALPTLGGYFVWAQDGTTNRFTVNYNNYDLEEQGVTFTLVVTDENGNVVEPVDGYYYMPDATGTYAYTATVTANGYQPKSDNHSFDYVKPNPAPAPTFSWNQETLTMTATCEGHVVDLYVNGTKMDNPYVATQTWEEQKLNFSAQTQPNVDETAPSAIVYYAENPVIIPAKPTTPSQPADFSRSYEDKDYFYVYADGPGVVLYDELGQEVDPQPYKIARPEYDPEGSSVIYVRVSATTQNENTETVHYSKTTTYYTAEVHMKSAPTVPELAGELVISECTPGTNLPDGDGGYFTVTYNGTDVAVDIVVTAEGSRAVLEPNDEGKYRLPNYGTYNVKAVASATDYQDKEATKQLVWNMPASAPADGVSVNLNDDHTTATIVVNGGNNAVIEGQATYDRPAAEEGDMVVTVTVITNDGEGVYAPTTEEFEVTIPAQLPMPGIKVDEENIDAWLPGQPQDSQLEHGYEYVLTFEVPAGYAPGDVHFTIGDGTERTWDGKPIILEDKGQVTIVAWIVKGDDQSPKNPDTFDLVNNFTSVNEIANGKAVAGVRYFNLAGQEMQEANGVTIVVTTYTDGTRSAVKVMK